MRTEQSEEEIRRCLALLVPEDVAQACRYLESLGLRFLVDFGYRNALTKARLCFELQTPQGHA